MLAALQRRELLRVAGQLSDETGVPFAEARVNEPIQGRLVRAIDMTSGRHALIERSRDFTLCRGGRPLNGTSAKACPASCAKAGSIGRLAGSTVDRQFPTPRLG